MTSSVSEADEFHETFQRYIIQQESHVGDRVTRDCITSKRQQRFNTFTGELGGTNLQLEHLKTD